MNWKKENYKINDKVIIIIKRMYSNQDDIIDGTIVYVGTKILKVQTEKRLIEFKAGRITSGGIFGLNFIVYKSIEEYKETTKKADDRYALRTKAGKVLHKLTNEQLQQILEWSKK